MRVCVHGVCMCARCVCVCCERPSERVCVHGVCVCVCEREREITRWIKEYYYIS